LTILAAPSLTDIEAKQYHATFSDVQTREQYMAIVSALAKRVEAAGKKPPVRDFL
jgi:DNA-binding transcriptional regulator YbjK